jgi:hypothetical protein
MREYWGRRNGMRTRVAAKGSRYRVTLALPILGISSPDRSKRESYAYSVGVEVEAASTLLVSGDRLEVILVEVAADSALMRREALGAVLRPLGAFPAPSRTIFPGSCWDSMSSAGKRRTTVDR